MPTMQAVSIHQLAALVAVEREASDRYRAAMVETRDAVLTVGTSSARYRNAADTEHDTWLTAIAARVDVDQALAAVAA